MLFTCENLINFLQNFHSKSNGGKENSKIKLNMSNFLRANRRKQKELEKKGENKTIADTK